MHVNRSATFAGALVFGVALALGVSCEPAAAEAPSKLAPPEPEPKPKPSKPLVPHKVVGGDTIPGVKRSLDVQLKGPIEEADLRALALALKAQEDGNYERTFIAYVLPGMKPGSGAWATTHFNPDLEVLILGLTVKQQKELAEAPRDDGRRVVGVWLDQSSSSKISVFRKKKGKTVYMEMAFSDGSKGENRMRSKKTRAGLRLDPMEKSSTGDHYVITKAGALESRDKDGLISSAPPLQK